MSDTGLYTIEVWDYYATRLADISRLCLNRHFVVTRNRPETIELTLNLPEAERAASLVSEPAPR